ncbi:MAG: polyprenyl synthetase family protein [Bacteroidetes bacterium]|nr:polyprenyl synthetase family protein [Bacteroidota bacterium]
MNALDRYRTLLDDAVAQWRPETGPATLYEPVRYILDLGGKRLRPVLVLLAAELNGGRAEAALGPALGIEWFHNFSLLHDDIMDQAALRRGKPTVHVRYSPSAAILSGDVMLVDAFRFLSQVRPELLPELLQRFSRTAVEVCEGQQMDMDFEKRQDVRVEEYLEMIRLKTAVLLGCSLYVGGRVGGSTSDQAEALYAFGEHLGLAFQLRDDLLDSYGDPDKFGKTVGGDILQDKKTYLFIHALERASTQDRQQLLNNPNKGSQKVEAVLALYARTGARPATEAAIQDHHQQALAALNRAALPPTGEHALRDLAEYLLVRES